MANLSLTIKGQDAMIRRLQEIGKGSPDIIWQAIYEEASEILTTAQQEFVPVDQGILRASGQVSEPTVTNGEASVTISFGGPSAPYALIQHERLDFNHTVGEAKYLETPLLQATQGMARRLGDRIRALFQ